MPYKLRKAPNRDLYWVVAQDGTKKSKDPIPLARAKAQMRALYASMSGGADAEDAEMKGLMEQESAAEMYRPVAPMARRPPSLFEPAPIRRVRRKAVKRKLHEITGFPDIPFGRHEARAKGRRGGIKLKDLLEIVGQTPNLGPKKLHFQNVASVWVKINRELTLTQIDFLNNEHDGLARKINALIEELEPMQEMLQSLPLGRKGEREKVFYTKVDELIKLIGNALNILRRKLQDEQPRPPSLDAQREQYQRNGLGRRGGADSGDEKIRRDAQVNRELIEFIIKKYPSNMLSQDDFIEFWRDIKIYLTPEEKRKFADLINNIEEVFDEYVKFSGYLDQIANRTFDVNKIPEGRFLLDMTNGNMLEIRGLIQNLHKNRWSDTTYLINNLLFGANSNTKESTDKFLPTNPLFLNLPQLSSSRYIPPPLKPPSFRPPSPPGFPPGFQPRPPSPPKLPPKAPSPPKLPPKPTGPKPTGPRPIPPAKPTGPRPITALLPPPPLDTNIPDYVEEEDTYVPRPKKEELPRLEFDYTPKPVKPKGLGKGKSSCKPPYHDYSKGKASAFVLGCIDPRYAYDVAYFLQHKKELHQDYDLFTLPGASLGADQKDWKKTFFDVLQLGLKLHGIKEVWCFDHLDCGMYKAVFDLETDMNPKIHIECMDKLKKEIKKKYPELKFRKFMVDAKGHISSV